MKIFPIYSKKKLRENPPEQDVYEYVNIPQSLRVQIVHIFRDAIGSSLHSSYGDSESESTYRAVHDAVARETGRFFIGSDRGLYENRIIDVILNEKDIDAFFDVVQLCTQIINNYIRQNSYSYKINAHTSIEPEEAISELNFRFREAGVGYEFVNNQFIRIDSQHMHGEVIKPALSLLSENLYEGANAEFRKAFDEYRQGGNHKKDALVEALKAFESTMKSICHKRRWQYNTNDNASNLIKVVLDNSLLPPWQGNNLNGVRAVLESVATPRNKMGGHGQGITPTEVPDFYVRFALNITASAIILLAEAEKALP